MVIYRDKEQQGSSFLVGSFGNRDNVTAPIQFRKRDSPSILKEDFSSRTDPSIFTSMAPELLNRSNGRGSVFPALK